MTDPKSKRRKAISQPSSEKTPGDSLWVTNKSSGNLPSTDSDHELVDCTPRRSSRKIKMIQQCVTSTPVKTNSQVLTRMSQRCSTKVQKALDVKPSDKKSKLAYRQKSYKSGKQTKRQTYSSDNSNSRLNRGSKTQMKTTEHATVITQRCRPRLDLDSSSSVKEDESLQSSDLSIELSLHEEPQPCISFQEEQEEESEEEEEEDLPSFLMVNTKSLSITKGGFAWYKLRNFPFWPAMVKSVNHKIKRASIMVVDEQLIQRKKGILVPLKTLKPYECEEFNELICKAKEKYDVAIQLSIDLIEDYIMRKGVGSFSGSFLEYYAHNISYPVRRKYQANAERLTFANDVEMEGSLTVEIEGSINEQQEDVKHLKRLLPDRTHAAHNRANEKLVQFIVKQGMVDQHLVAVMSGLYPSKWLHLFFTARRRRIVNIYLEDDEQLDQVYRYLSKLYTSTAETDACFEKVKTIDRVPFILDVLLPEAIIHAIAGVDNVSLKKAEEKYMQGRCISNRERQEFDLMIEQQMK